MRLQPCLLSLILAINGCASFHSTKMEKWRASVANGDKPGIGIEIARTDNKIAGSMFILDPNKPNNFSAGLKMPILILKFSDEEIQFEVKGYEISVDKFVLDFDEPLSNKTVHAVLKQTNTTSSPQNFEFHRVQ